MKPVFITSVISLCFLLAYCMSLPGNSGLDKTKIPVLLPGSEIALHSSSAPSGGWPYGMNLLVEETVTETRKCVQEQPCIFIPQGNLWPTSFLYNGYVCTNSGASPPGHSPPLFLLHCALMI